MSEKNGYYEYWKKRLTQKRNARRDGLIQIGIPLLCKRRTQGFVRGASFKRFIQKIFRLPHISAELQRFGRASADAAAVNQVAVLVGG